MNTTQNKVIDYYQNLESRLGYALLTWNTKHLGYYPPDRKNIGEKEAQRLMIELLADKLQLYNSDLVLDAGCGRGTTTCYLAAKYGADITGIDIVPFELKMAEKLAKRNKLENKAKFYLKDYSSTGFLNDYFDKIFTLESLVHSPDLDKTLNEFRRILKPKGLLVLFEYSRAHPNKFSKRETKIFKLISKYTSSASLNEMFHETLVKSVEIAGFNVLSDKDITGNILPSGRRFNDLAKFTYPIVKFFHLEKYFINTTAAVEFYILGKKGLLKYRTIVAQKPLIT